MSNINIRFPNAPLKYDQPDQDQFRRAVERALQQGVPLGTTGGGTGVLQIKRDDVNFAGSVGTLDFVSADFDLVHNPAGEVNFAIGAAISRVGHTHVFTDITGTLPYNKLPTGGGTWANGGNLTLTGGLLIIGSDPGGFGGTLRVSGGGDFGSGLAMTGASVEMDFKRTTNAVNEKTWNWFPSTTTFSGRLLSDDRLSSNNWIVVTRSGITVSAIDFYTGSSSLRWEIDSTGRWLAGADNTQDVGATGASRPRTVYAGTSVITAALYSPAATALNLGAALANQWQITVSPGTLSPLTDNAQDLGGSALRVRDGYLNRLFIGNATVGHVGAKITVGDTTASTANAEFVAGGRIDHTFWDTSAALDERRVDTFSLNGVGGPGSFIIGVSRTDAGAAGNQMIRAFRTGNAWTSVRVLDNGTGFVQLGNGNGVYVGPSLGSTEQFHVNGSARISGDLNLNARLVFSTAASKIVPGATSLSLRNNADAADNLLLTDAGLATFRNTLTVSTGAAAALVQVSANAGQSRDVIWQTAGVSRWTLRATNAAESGANAGSDFILVARDDAGVSIDTPITIVRAAGGTMALSRPLTAASTLAVTGDLTVGARLIFTAAAARILMGANSLTVRDSADAASIMTLSVGGALTLLGTVAELGLGPRSGGGSNWELYVPTTASYRLYHAGDQFNFTDTEFVPSTTGAKTLGTSGLRWGKLWAADGDFTLDVKMDVLGTFDHTGTRFTTGTGPVADDVMSWHGGAGKWRPRFLQTSFTSGAAVSQNNTDGTFSTFFNSAPALSGVPTAPTNAPVTTAMYKAVLIDMSAYVLGATQVYVLDYSINGAAYSTDRIISTSAKVIHSSLDPTKTYAYKYKIRGGSDSAYSPAAGAINPSTATEANAFGLIVASQIATAFLSSINANIGSITAGQLVSGDGKSILQLDSTFSVPGTVTQGIFFASANPVGGGITGMYIDFTATGANPLFHHANIDLLANGSATFKGLVDITNAPLSLGFGGAFIVMRDADVAHGMTSAVPTDVLGAFLAGDALAGGLLVTGWADSTVGAMRIEGYNVGASTTTAVMSFVVGKKSGASVGALAASDLAMDFKNLGTTLMRLFGDGLVVIDQQVNSSLEINQTVNPSTRRALGVFHGRVDAGATEAVLVDAEWNTTGAPTILKMTLVDTASDAASLLADWQVGGSSKFKVRKDGRLTITDALVLTPAASKIIPGATNLSLRNNADSADNLLIADAGDATFRTFIEQNEMAAPATPAANKTRMYAKDLSGVSALYYKNDAGTEIPLGFNLIDTQTFTATGAGTWTKPAGAKLVRVVVIGAGGGGGGGRSGATGTARVGGTGGGGGAMTERWHDASHLGATEAVSVGTGGTSGAGGTGGGNGADGGAGGDSWFGNATRTSAKQWGHGGGSGAGGLLATARSGGGGGGMLTAGGAGSSADSVGGGPVIAGVGGQAFGGGNGLISTTAGNPSMYGGGSGGGGQAGGGAGGAGGVSQMGGGGGGGGGGVNTSDVGAAGGTGGDNDLGLTGGGPNAGIAGNNGDNFRAGQGGGGGTGANGAGNAGGAGGAPGGGGGGGGAGNTASGGGAGGVGGRGEVRVYSYA